MEGERGTTGKRGKGEKQKRKDLSYEGQQVRNALETTKNEFLF
jgi:hypothetical protein